MLRLRGASKRHGRKVLWDGLSVDVAAREVLAVTGPSGSGKSTLLDCMGLVARLDAGTIHIDGTEVGRSRRRDRIARREVLGFLFQDFGLVPDMTVGENIAIASVRRSPGPRSPSTSDALARVGLQGTANHHAYELSGGEQQRVALARLIVKQPRLILADEPTSALDGANARIVLDVLGEFAEGGAAVVIATHSADVCAAANRQLELVSVTAGPPDRRAVAGPHRASRPSTP